MQPTEEITQHLESIMLDIMVVLYSYGIRTVHVGALMRLLGIENESAVRYDEDVVVLDERFGEKLAKLFAQPQNSAVPDGVTLH